MAISLVAELTTEFDRVRLASTLKWEERKSIMKFIEIARVNAHNEEKPTLINLDHVSAVTEIHVEPTRLYDQEGNVVEEREADKRYHVVLSNGFKWEVTNASYDALKKALTE